jgi:hypothetical protein
VTKMRLYLRVIRFNPAGTGNPAYPANLLFYSDNVDSVDSSGETPSPPTALYTNRVTIPKLGDELTSQGLAPLISRLIEDSSGAPALGVLSVEF